MSSNQPVNGGDSTNEDTSSPTQAPMEPVPVPEISNSNNLNEASSRSPEVNEQNIETNDNAAGQVADDNDSSNAEPFEDANEVNEFDQYFVHEPMDDEDADDGEFIFDESDEDEDEEGENDEDEDEDDEDEDEEFEELYQANEDEYENVEKPDRITYNTELPSSHDYLGRNFQDVESSKYFHESNEEIQIPLLPLPGNSYYENETETYVQLIPGQIMPIYFYAPTHIQVVRKRMSEQNPTIGFVLSPKSLRETNETNRLNDANDPKLGILAEIMSVSRHNEENEIFDFSSLIEGTGGIILKIKGRERFHINSIRKDITGCFIANVRILPEYVFTKNPLIQSAMKNTSCQLDAFLHKSKNSKIQCSYSKAEYLNVQQAHPAWLLRRCDSNYLVYLIKKELSETFGEHVSTSDETEACSENDTATNAVVFSSWLLSNFPFDNKMRINCLKMNCINERLNYMYDLLKNFTNINCRACGAQFCTKYDVFSISKQGYMSAFLNPGGVVHETLTVYKLKNFTITSSRPSTQHSWFPGFGWQICVCRRCHSHIGWKFTAAEDNLKPEKFWGLTRKAIRYTYNTEQNSSAAADASRTEQLPEDNTTRSLVSIRSLDSENN